MDLASKLFSFMGFFAFIQTLLPPPLRKSLDRSLDKLWTWLYKSSDPFVYFEVLDYVSGKRSSRNAFYGQVGLYLGSLETTIQKQSRVNVHQFDEASSLSYSLPVNETLEDGFRGARVWWTHKSISQEGESRNEQKSFSLKMLKSDRPRLLTDYFDHISKCAVEILRKNTKRYLYSNKLHGWESVPFQHPATFDTLALDANWTERIIRDLRAFAQGEDYYHRIGRAWKRGYLLYGPPGTGKSSLIAAIANFLHYDVYDLELTRVCENSELKTLLTHTTRKSVIVIEDIDCSVDLSDRKSKAKVPYQSSVRENVDMDKNCKRSDSEAATRLTLSGLLNFTDGLWSCCGEERIFIFTTNHKEKLDSALLRSGRMDLHILLSYCTFASLKKLATNYLDIEDHVLYGQLEKAMEAGCNVTPAEVAEALMSNKDDPEAALKQVLAMVDEARATAEKQEEQIPMDAMGEEQH